MIARPLLALCCCILFTACVGNKRAEPLNTVTIAEVEERPVFVLLPANYSPHVDNTLIFTSSGAAEDLPVYPSHEAALRELKAFEAVNERARHLWRVYRLEATWDKNVVRVEGDGYRLKTSAPIAEAAE